MQWRIAVFGTLGAVATVVAALFVLAPGVLLVIGPVRETVTSLGETGPKAVMTTAAAVAGLYALAASRSAGGKPTGPEQSPAEERFETAATDPPEAVTADRRSMTASELDADVEVAVAAGKEPLQALRDLLRTLVIDTYTTTHQLDEETARQAVETGAWTDDRVAAAFLADEGPTASLLSRIRLWLAPERERERRIERTLDEIERLRRDR